MTANRRETHRAERRMLRFVKTRSSPPDGSAGRRGREVLDDVVEAVGAGRLHVRGDLRELLLVALLAAASQLLEAAVEEAEADDLVGVLDIAHHVEADPARGRAFGQVAHERLAELVEAPALQLPDGQRAQHGWA